MNEQYNLLAEFGRVDGQTVYLARERTTGQVAIARRPADDPSAPLTISHVLDGTVPADGAVCPYCMDDLRTWGRFCPSCGREVFGAQATSSDSPSSERLLSAVRNAAEGRFDVLGSVPRAEGGDTVYFAVDLNTADVVALLLNREGIEADGTLAYSLELVLTLSPVAAAPLPSAAAPPPPPAAPPVPVTSRIIPPSATPRERPRRTTTPIPEPTLPIVSAPMPPLPPKRVPQRRPLPKAVVFGAVAAILVIGVVFVVMALMPKSEPAPVAVARDTTPTPAPVADTAKPQPAPDTTTVAAAPEPPAPAPVAPAPVAPAPTKAPAPVRR